MPPRPRRNARMMRALAARIGPACRIAARFRGVQAWEGKAMKVLVMGGTRFNGLALVHELVRHGHDVTVFNRGQSEAVLPAGVRRLYGDRNEHEALTAMMKGEDFDVV